MRQNRPPGAERPEQRPIYRLIQVGEDKLPAHFKSNRVEDGRIVEDTDEGRVEIGIVALPPEDTQSGLGRFWNKVKAILGSQRPKTAELPPTLVAARPQLFADEYIPETHVQLMAHMPFVVLEDDTRYGIVVTVPAELRGAWEAFEAPAKNQDLIAASKIEIGRRRKGVAVVIRTDDCQPLTRQDLGTTAFPSFQEILSGGFQPVGSDPSKERLLIDKRSTVEKGSSLGVGEEREGPSIEEALLFSALGANKGVGTVADRKGRIEVVVYEIVEEEVSEIIDKPIPGLIRARSEFETLFGGGDSASKSGFSAGETRFGGEKRRKVNVRGVTVERPLAAFQVVLVGELPEQAMEMVTNR